MADLVAPLDQTPAAPMVNRGAAPTLEDWADETAARGNVIDLLEDDQIKKAGETALTGWRIDKASNDTWENEVRAALGMMSRLSEKDGEEGKGAPTKNYPFEGASNVIWPITQEAAIQFHARAYPAIIAGPDVVKGKVRGSDPGGEKFKRAERVAKHMSDQLMEQSDSFEGDTDTLLLQLPIIGQAFDKVFWNADDGRPDVQLVSALNVKVNRNTRGLRSCPRLTEEIETYPYEIAERVLSGRYREIDLGLKGDADEQKPQRLLESHIRLDLDRDGYAEPWIVTLHERGEVLAMAAGWSRDGVKRDVRRVQQMVPHVVGQDPFGRPLLQMVPQTIEVPGDLLRIDAQRYYVGYSFLPDPAGGFYGLGFARLLAHPQAAVNAAINSIIDAAKIQNAGGGLISDRVNFNARGGEIRMNPTKWTTVRGSGDDIRKNIISYADIHPGPSAAMFQVLGLLLEMAKGASFMTDALTGDVQKQMQPTTLLALIEQGLQVFGSAFKRIFRSRKSVYEMIYDLNGLYLDQESYQSVLDEQADVRADYGPRAKDFDLAPVADPTQVTAMQRMALSQYLLQFYGQPDSNNIEIKKYALEAARIENPERFIVEPSIPPEVTKKIALELAEMRTKIGVNVATIIEKIANAESKEAGSNMAEYTLAMQTATTLLAALDPTGGMNGQGGLAGVVGQPGGRAPAGVPAALPGGMPGGMGGPPRPAGPGLGAGASGAVIPNGGGA